MTQLSNKDSKIWWVITELIQLIILSMGANILLWMYAPYWIWFKLLITMVSLIITYDFMQVFIKTRLILIEYTT